MMLTAVVVALALAASAAMAADTWRRDRGQ